MGANVGRDVLVEFSIADESAVVGSLSWLTLGMMRGKDLKTTWDTADTTADDSPDYTKTQLVTFKNVEFSGNGVSYTDALYNQKTLRAHVMSPGAGTGNQPKAWFRITYPDASFVRGPFIVSEFNDSAPHADACTWSMKAMSNGAVTYTP